MSPVPAPPQAPRWQHPLVVLGVSLLVVSLVIVVIAVAVGRGPDDEPPGEATDPAEVPTPVLPDETDEPDEADEPDDPLALPEPAAPSIPRVEPDRPDRDEFLAAVRGFLDAWVAGDRSALAESTWSGCENSGADLAAELATRSGRSEVVGYGLATTLVISHNLGVADAVHSDGEAPLRLVFVREDGAWRSGLCALPDADLATTVELPDDLASLVALAGLDYTGAELTIQPFASADLAYAIFDDADLSGSNLDRARIEQASFRGADLSDAWLGGASAATRGADFTGATLVRTLLFQADLSGSSFRDADARFADFTAADLTDVDFSGANLDNAVLDPFGARLVVDWTDAICPDGELADPADGCLEHLDPFG